MLAILSMFGLSAMLAFHVAIVLAPEAANSRFSSSSYTLFGLLIILSFFAFIRLGYLGEDMEVIFSGFTRPVVGKVIFVGLAAYAMALIIGPTGARALAPTAFTSVVYYVNYLIHTAYNKKTASSL